MFRCCPYELGLRLCSLALLVWILPPQHVRAQPTPAPAKTGVSRAAPKVKYTCDIKGIRSLRNAAKADLEAGKVKRAAARFEGFDCYLDPKDEDFVIEWAWMLSDETYILYKAGRYRDCYALAYSQSDPYPNHLADLVSPEEPVMKALAHNEALCEKELKKEWADFLPAVKCPIEGHSCTHGVPSSLLKTGTSACLSLESGEISPTSELYEGGDVDWITRTQKRVSTRFLTRNLGDAPCNIEGVAFRRNKGRLQIMVHGQGRDCSGGQAAFSFRDIYELTPGGLKKNDEYTVYSN